MDDDDPERRISELESQLADQKNVAGPRRDHDSPLTPEDVHNVAFSSAPAGRRGYNEDAVDAFLNRVETALQDPRASNALTAADICNTAFPKPPIGRRGYNEDEVDEFLRRVAREVADRSGQPLVDPGPRHLRGPEESTAEKVVGHVFAFGTELFGDHSVVTWRAPLVLGLIFILLGFVSHPAFFVVAAFCFLWAVVAWRTGS
jgi:DivIVA domain-containing protein